MEPLALVGVSRPMRSAMPAGALMMALGAGLYGLGYLMASTGSSADANIGAGLIALLGCLGAGVGAVVLAAGGIAVACMRLRKR